MTIFARTSTSTITLVQAANDGGSQNTPYTALLGASVGTLGDNLLPSRSELYDYTSLFGRSEDISVGIFGGEGDFINFTASSTITFTQTAARSGVSNLTAGNTLTVAQSTIAGLPKPVTGSNSLTFTQISDSSIITRTATNTLVLSQEADLGEVNELTAENTITFSQLAESHLLTRNASNTLALIQSNNRFTQDSDAIALTSTSTLTFSQTNNRVRLLASGITLTSTDTLTFSQRAIFPIELSAAESVVFTQVATANAGKGAAQDITFVQTVIANHWRSLTASSTLALRHTFTYGQFRDCVPVTGIGRCDATKIYAPYSGGDGSPDLRPIPPTITKQTDVEFFYPIGGICNATESIILRTPNFGDRDRNQYNRINRESRGGSLTIFRDPKWPSERSLVMDFSGIKDSQVDGIVSFLETTLGQEVGFRDWNNRVWFGIITNPDSAITRTGTDRNDIAIELEVNDTLLELNACSSIAFSDSTGTVLVP